MALLTRCRKVPSPATSPRSPSPWCPMPRQNFGSLLSPNSNLGDRRIRLVFHPEKRRHLADCPEPVSRSAHGDMNKSKATRIAQLHARIAVHAWSVDQHDRSWITDGSALVIQRFRGACPHQLSSYTLLSLSAFCARGARSSAKRE